MGTDTGKVTLTMREHERDERIPVPPSEWMFAYCPQGGTTSEQGDAQATVPSLTRVFMNIFPCPLMAWLAFTKRFIKTWLIWLG